MNRRIRKRALSMLNEDVSCVALDDRGDLVCQRMGGPSAFLGEDPIIIHQKGLLAPEVASRTHRNLLSNFKITTPAGSVHVPWNHFAWLPEHENRLLQGTGNDLQTCLNILSIVSANHILVVWIHGECGERLYEWYVAFKGKRDGKAVVLTRVPHHFLKGIIDNSGISSFCKCGKCEHPLLRMMNTCKTESASVFELRAVKYFQEYAKMVYKYRDDHKEGKIIKEHPKSSLTDFEEGVCAICLEDTYVSSSACSHGACKLQICSECHVKTRGLCAVCDRSKNNCAFLCMTCDELSDMVDFGYACIRCERPSLCSTCYKNFEFCVHCARDIASSKSCGKKA